MSGESVDMTVPRGNPHTAGEGMWSYACEWEALRMERGWPTPNHMRKAADALDMIMVAKYGDILRFVADLCDEVGVAGLTEERSSVHPVGCDCHLGGDR